MVFWWHFRYLVIAKLDISVLWLSWGPCWSVWEWKIRDSWHPEFSLWSRLQTPALIQEGPGGQFSWRATVWIHICSRMVPRFQELLHVNPWRVHRTASRDPPGLTKALKKAECRARYPWPAWPAHVQGSFITVDRAPSPPPHSGTYLGIRYWPHTQYSRKWLMDWWKDAKVGLMRSAKSPPEDQEDGANKWRHMKECTRYTKAQFSFWHLLTKRNSGPRLSNILEVFLRS